eukprot:CAMPEP_0203821916 /NCGR_PEP_ID=MMETSP0115-20131106/44693_1 /ASSEMBLY_ACC=CAM_ASM_000227 /TAXON_ID=33651 /ORGANISM="Bicosoecid sp, Strain ms1" /LENGTH=189 /DNA_ID=CAMNT_0050730945 /DNA_START=90 /DNA_END=656 /DNA_ORIENTATION=+
MEFPGPRTAVITDAPSSIVVDGSGYYGSFRTTAATRPGLLELVDDPPPIGGPPGAHQDCENSERAIAPQASMSAPVAPGGAARARPLPAPRPPHAVGRTSARPATWGRAFSLGPTVGVSPPQDFAALKAEHERIAGVLRRTVRCEAGLRYDPAVGFVTAVDDITEDKEDEHRSVLPAYRLPGGRRHAEP